MAQQIVVAALKKQITDKKTALENALKQSALMRKKLDADRDKIQADYEKACDEWDKKLRELVQTITLTNENSRVNTNGYGNHETFSINITLPKNKVPKRPVRKDIVWKDYDVEVPAYYDGRNNQVDSKAVLAHFAKSLDMLAVIPTGTVEITVRDYNFLTKF